MKTLDQPEVRAALVARLRRLTPDAPARWGKMTCPQMLAHVADSMERVFGGERFTGDEAALPWLIKLLALKTSMDWPKGMPSGGDPAAVAVDAARFEEERERAIAALEAMAAADGSGFSPEHPAFGRMSARDWWRWAERHLDHHLRQFGA